VKPTSLPPALDPAPSPIAEWEQRVGGLAHLPGLLRSLGADPTAVLGVVGLGEEALSSADNLLPFAAAVAALNQGVRATRCPHLGLLSGALWRLDDFGLIGRIMRHSATVGDALEAFAVHQRLHSKGAAVYFRRHRSSADIGYVVHHPQVDLAAPLFDTAAAVGASFLRELLGPAWRPGEVFLPRRAPADPAPWRRMFGCPVRFSSSECALRFPARDLDMPVPGADPARREAAEEELARLLDDDLVALLYRAVRVLLLEGAVTGKRLAEHMAMHRRTLDRRLQRRGSSVQAIFDDVRYEVARQLLRETTQPVTEVAHAAGFADATSFIRAFRGWAGTSPGLWRAAQAAGSDASALQRSR
jgi:AraC-like DNA-binding protein